MDNRLISIQSEGRKTFDLAFELLFDNAPGGVATHYFDHPIYGFLLLWHEDSFTSQDSMPHLEKANKLPYPMNCEQAAEFVWGWLQAQPNKSYRECLDHDGSNGKGFKVYNEDWGHVAGSHYAFLGVLPIWAWYGK